MGHLETKFPHLAVTAAALKTQASAIDLQRLRTLGDSPAVAARLQDLLVQPSHDILNRPSHKFRAQLVEVGWLLGSTSDGPGIKTWQLDICAEVIEYLHLGSLIVDDIQDGSEVRRNGPALHCVLGTPHALAVGNWLYFHALSILDRLDLEPLSQLRLFRNFHRLVEIAHYGQALDVCIKIDKLEDLDELVALCESCLNYKTGAIVALAMVMGGCLAGASDERLAAIEALGSALGAYLQRYNDVGNLLGAFDEEKKLEDMLGKKPSFVWSFVIQAFGAEGFRKLQEALKLLPDESALYTWMKETAFAQRAKDWIEASFEESLTDFTEATKMLPGDLKTLLKLRERIQKAYV